MYSRLLFFLQQQVRAGRAALLSICFGTVSALAAIGLWLYVGTSAEDSEAELAALRIQAIGRVELNAPREAEPSLLPSFNSADFAARFHQTASEIKLATDEVTYGLEAAPGQPFQRYRISLAVKSDYPTIRRFIAALGSDFSNVTLDRIRCSRENLAASSLACELTFSAFFRLDKHV